MALLACSTLLVAALGVLFAHQAQADRFDRTIDAPIITWLAGHPALAVRLASPGSLIPAAVLSASMVIACLVVGRLNGAVLALVAVPVSVGLDERLFKPLFGRTYHGNLVYPSGHATAVFAIAATVAVLVLLPPQRSKEKVLRTAIAAATCLLGCIVAVAVIGLRWHYFTDTVGGTAVGVGTVCGLALVLDLPIVRSWLARVSRPSPAAAER